MMMEKKYSLCYKHALIDLHMYHHMLYLFQIQYASSHSDEMVFHTSHFCLTISLRMISRTQLQLSSQSFLLTFPKLRSKPRISIKHNARWNDMQSANFATVIPFLLGIKYADFVNRLTITQIESLPFTVLRNAPTKSIDILSHFHSSINKGCNIPDDF